MNYDRLEEDLRRAAFRGPTLEAADTKDLRWQAAEAIAALRTALTDLLAACDKGRPHERGVGGMTIDAQMRRTVLNGVPQWPVEQARERMMGMGLDP